MLGADRAADEGLYTYFDDIDICLRARRAGWETWYVPESKIIHLGGASTGIASHLVKPRRRPSYWYQARHRFFTKNYGALYAALADAAFISGYAIWRLGDGSSARRTPTRRTC